MEPECENVSIYGDHLPELEATLAQLEDDVDCIRREMTAAAGQDPIDHCLSRIKNEESMREKCRRRGVPETTQAALTQIHDAVGLRIVCAFLSDVYTIRDRLLRLPDIELLEEKDYIRRAKPNGYRSLHLILLVNGGVHAEVQLRTISQDTWAALEHQMRYKKSIPGNAELIAGELKRCADELASTDISMQTIRDMINAPAQTV